ncbi:MAG: ABC transporter ATP-binding protein [Actinomycetota bacterium]|nr:ABC transporter ATP-binding protein [Actinomycetota bacterium]
MSPAPDDATAGQRVTVRGAIKRYGAATALSGIDLDVPAGRFLVLLGPSGSGKSTLVRSLAGVERLDAGQIHLDGQMVNDGRRQLPPESRNLAMVFQDYALWPHLTVTGNVGYALRRRHLPRAENLRRTGEALDRVGLTALADRYPHQLSGGEQQRVALARAVVARPGLLLFDEPLSNLDADLRERLRVEIATVTRESGATAVYITHDQSEAFALADEIGVLDHGQLVQLGTPEEVYRRPSTPFVARFTGLAAELTGHATRVTGDTVEVAVADGTLGARKMGPVSAGEKVHLLVRPTASQILTTGHHRVGTLSGTVTDVAYRGRGYDHVITTAAGSLTAVFDISAHGRGTPATLAVDPDGCLAYNAARSTPHSNSTPADLTAVTLLV